MIKQSHPRKLFRSRTDRYIGGVAAGIAHRFDIDPAFVRIAFVISFVFGGVGLLAYAVLLAALPVEGDPTEPLPPVEPRRRNLMIALAAIVGIFAVATADSGGFATWVFGFAPGTVFGTLFWIGNGIAIAWLIGSDVLGDWTKSTAEESDAPTYPEPSPEPDAETIALAAAEPGTAPKPESDPEPVARPSTFAESPTQVSTAVMPVRGTSPDTEASGQDGRGSSLFGRVMFWVAIGLAALTLFCLLFVLSAGTTVVFGGAPVAVLVIVVGAAMVFAGLRGRRNLSLWLLTAAVALTLPMAVVSIADLRVEGSYGDLNETPQTTAEIPTDGYRMAAGNMTIDLRKLDFNRYRSVNLPVKSGIGLTSIIVPDRVCVASDVSGRVGLIDVRGRQLSGINITRDFNPPQGPAPRLKLDGEFKLGAIEVVDATAWANQDALDGGRPDGNRRSGGIDWRASDPDRVRGRSDDACRPAVRPERSPG